MADKHLGAKMAETVTIDTSKSKSATVPLAVFNSPHPDKVKKAGWLIDDNDDGDAVTKILGWAIRSGHLRKENVSNELVKGWNLYEHGFHRELIIGMKPKDITEAHVGVEKFTGGMRDHVLIDAVGGGEFRRVGDRDKPYRLHILGMRDGKPRKIEVKPGSHRLAGDRASVVLDVTHNEVWILHPDLVARDVTEEGSKVEFVEP